jgi:hypothetical protein
LVSDGRHQTITASPPSRKALVGRSLLLPFSFPPSLPASAR